MVKGYCFLIKLAVTDLSEFITTLVLFDVPVAPDQLWNKYSADGVAVMVAVLPSSYCWVDGNTVPPLAGLAEVVKE